MEKSGHFGNDFYWGAATAAFQIEGGWNEDGKGESNWDRWCHTPGKIKGGGTGDVAIDHYHRWQEDVELMRQIGLNAYRMSIAWSRVQPDGRGALNPKGLAFYDQLIDKLLKSGIEPFVTLCHYDIPQALEDQGGWVNREMTDWFADYSAAMVRHFGDRVSHWMTINEPNCIASLGYERAFEPPGLNDPQAGIQASHHLLLAHGKALAAIKAAGGSHHQVGLVCNLYAVHPAPVTTSGNKEKDLARVDLDPSMKTGDKELFTEENRVAAVRLMDGYANRWWLDPLYQGSYPQDIWECRDCRPIVQNGDMAVIGVRPDFYGVNYYVRSVVKPILRNGKLHYAGVPSGDPTTSMGWGIYPEGVYEVLTRLKNDYDNPVLYVTENGMALDDPVATDNAVHDNYRIDFLRRHFEQAARCLADGVQLKGYFVWSLLDNFEWEAGWGQRFGIIRVDYQTLDRTVKDSGWWYRDFIKSQK